jgi:hypothetical protein
VGGEGRGGTGDVEREVGVAEGGAGVIDVGQVGGGRKGS